MAPSVRIPVSTAIAQITEKLTEAQKNVAAWVAYDKAVAELEKDVKKNPAKYLRGASVEQVTYDGRFIVKSPVFSTALLKAPKTHRAPKSDVKRYERVLSLLSMATEECIRVPLGKNIEDCF